MPNTEPPSMSPWMPRRLRSRQVNWITGSIPACFSMMPTARLETWTIADWLSVTL